ncbi:MAG: DUF924 family protein, partial [Oxalobacteraceae bacterium]
MNTPLWQPILDFWFLPAGAPGCGQARPEWFRKDAGFDAQIRVRFGPLLEQALSGALASWDSSPAGALARILLLDQFTRNVFRDSARAFAGDALALASAQAVVARGDDRRLAPLQRYFIYMPFEHAEDLTLQERSVALFSQLQQEGEQKRGAFAGALDYALQHR